MKWLRATLVALATLAVVALPATARADNPPPGSIPPRDGHLYAWAAAYYQNWPPSHPVHCRWFDQDNNWGDSPCGLNFRNVASSLYNNSSTNRPVNLYYHPGYQGAWACLAAGHYWDNLQNRRFSWGTTRSGYMSIANDNIASHRWRANCGEGYP